MENNPLVSIIVPVYNVEQYLDECIQSIINQSYSNFEMILVDDGSTDRSGEICDYYSDIDDRVIAVHKKNGGQSSARNTGLEIAAGKYIGFVDSDDCVEKNYLETLLDLCISNNMGMSCINYNEIIDGKKDREEPDGKTVELNSIKFLEEIVRRDHRFNITYCVWTKLFRRDIVEDLRFPEGKVYEEIMYITKAVKESNGCIYKNAKLYNYRIREGSTTKSKYVDGFDDRLLTDRLLLQKEQISFVKNYMSNELAKEICFEYYDEIFNILRLNKNKNLTRIIKRTLKEFSLNFYDVLRLPYSSKRKIQGFLKMKLPDLVLKLEK